MPIRPRRRPIGHEPGSDNASIRLRHNAFGVHAHTTRQVRYTRFLRRGRELKPR